MFEGSAFNCTAQIKMAKKKICIMGYRYCCMGLR